MLGNPCKMGAILSKIRRIITVIKVLFVCHGNICRSPMGEAILKDYVKKRGLEDLFYIDSAATHRDAIGMTMYYPAVDELNKHDIEIGNHRARLITKNDYNNFDYILCMDNQNVRNIKRIVGNDNLNKVHMLKEFIGSQDEIDDPWYTGDYRTTYNELVETITAFMNYLGY